MNAAEHNELTSLIRALPPLDEALSEESVEHLMLLPSGRWTARQEGVARRRTTVLDEPSLEALATWLLDHPGARLDGTWLFDVVPGVRGLLVTAERCPTPSDALATPLVMEALKKQITRGENGVILGPVRARKLELLCWIAQQFIQEQIILISDRPPTAQLGPRVVHLFPPRTPEELARVRRLIRRCDAVLWDEVESKEVLQAALGYPGAKRRWITMDAATTRAGFEALGRRLVEMAPGDVSSIMLADSRSGQLSHLLRRVGGSWQEVTEEANSVLPLLEAHLETSMPIRNRYEDYRSTVEVQEIRFETYDPPHQEEPEDIEEPHPRGDGIEGLADILSEVEEIEELADPTPSHVMAASSIDELLEDSEGTDTSEVSDSVVREVLDETSNPMIEIDTDLGDPLYDSEALEEVGPSTPSDPLPLDEQSGEKEELEAALAAQDEPQETAAEAAEVAEAVAEDAVEDAAEPVEEEDEDEDSTAELSVAGLDMGMSKPTPESQREEVAENNFREPFAKPAPVDEASIDLGEDSEIESEDMHRPPISERLTEQISPEEVQAAVEARERELAGSREFSEFELEEIQAPHEEEGEEDELEHADEAISKADTAIRSGETLPGDSLAEMQEALSLAEAEIHASFSADNDMATNPVIETPDIQLDADIPILDIEDSPATQEFYVNDSADADLEHVLPPEEDEIDRFEPIDDMHDNLDIMLEDFSEEQPPMELEVNIPEDTQVEQHFALDPDALVDNERRAHLNDLLRIEAELQTDLASDSEVTGLHSDPAAIQASRQPEPNAGQAMAEEMFSALDEIYSEASLQPPKAPEGVTPPEQGDPTVLTSIPDEPVGREIPVDDDDVPLLSWDDDEETKQHERSKLSGTPVRSMSDEDPPDADVSTSTSVKLNALSQRLRALRQRRQQKSGQFSAYSADDGEESEAEESPREKRTTNLLEALKRDKKS